ncbi:MAG TPA: PQQ-dependent sugar dehydrogenase [Sphingomicrobium sp.]|nr:PQQ-dependent sugar dehydrogenase [Sphingomicrobium sp.]
MVLSACGASQPSSAETNSDTGAGTAQNSATRPFTVTEVASFTTPWAMDFLPGSGVPLTNAALLTEKEGTLWLIDVVTGKRQQVAGVPAVKVAGQGGLGDVVAHPGFAGNQRIYLSFAEAGSDGTSGAAVGYGRLILADGQPRIDGFRVIWRQQPKVGGSGHFSHRIAFAPDGTMFVSSGERQKFDPAQDMSVNLGKILHLTDEGAPVPGNPWAQRGGIAATFWTIGHRNVLGLSFAPDGRLWETEMGPMGGDELNLILPGRNYGWPEVSYGSHYDGRAIPDDHESRGFEEPKAWWNPSISPGALLIYSGDKFPKWKGDALIGALSGQALIRVDIEGDDARKADQWDMGARIRAVDQGPGGEVYLLEDGGRLLRLEPARG